LWEKKEKPQPKSQMEQNAIQALKNDPQMRMAFINKVAGAHREQDVPMQV
jgi:hypothetical protein